MTWTAPEPPPHDGPTTGAERPLLQGYLDFQRTTLRNVCAGLTAEQLVARAAPPSALSLLGIVRHMAKVERIWLRERVAAQGVASLHGGPGHPSDFRDTDPARAGQELAALVEEWRLCDEAVAAVPLTHEIVARGATLSLRMVYLHLIGEYARHNGHADLLREAVDGVTGR